MGVLFDVVQIVAPVFLLAGLGFAWVRIGFDYDVAFVTRLAMSLAIPCLIFMSLVRTEIDPRILRDSAIATLMAYAATGGALYFIINTLGLDRRTYWAPLTFGNTGNLGLPIALFAFGAEGLGFAVVVFAVMLVLQFTLGVWVVSGRSSPLTMLREPMVWATVLGGVFLIAGWSLPVWAGNTLDLIGQLGIPLMLITLGVAMSRLRPAAVGRAFGLSAVKLAVSLALALLAGYVMGLPGVAMGVLVLQLATPVPVTNFMLAQKYGANATEVAGLVVVSTLLSVLSLPVILGFFI
ncbi:MAG: AEC family transporter [Pseudomonadota bacterium]